MAQVPNYGGHQVMPSIFGYKPVSTDIPKVPEMNVQKSLASASDKLDAWYSKFLAEQDDARVTEAITDLRRKAIDMETGEGGWASTLGANALEPDMDGKGLVERMDEGLQGYGTEIAARLTPRQQKMFTEKAQAIYTSSYSGVSQHVYQQALGQKKAAHEGAVAQAVESGAAYALKPDMLAQSASTIRESAQKLAEFQGWTPENTELYVKKQLSGMYMNAIADRLAGADRNPVMGYQALGILKAHSKEMLASDVARARQQINPIVQAHEDRLKVERYAASLASDGSVLSGGMALAVQRGVVSQDFVQTARGFEAVMSVGSGGGHQSVTTKEGPVEAWKHGASQLTVEQGMEAAKLAKQPWDVQAFKTDRNYNQMLGLARYGDMLTEFADEQMAIAGYLTDKETVRNAEKQAAEKGGVWTDYLPEKTQSTLQSAMANMRKQREVVDSATGKTVAGFDPKYAAAAKQGPTADQIREDLKRTDARAAADPLYCDELVAKAVTLVNEKKASYVQEQNNIKAQISNVLFQTHGNLDAVPQALLQRLDVNEHAAVMKIAKHYQSDTFASNPFTLGKLSDDDFLAALPENELTLYLNDLNGTDRQRMLTRWSMLKQKQVAANDARAGEIRAAQTGEVLSDYVVESGTIKNVLRQNPTLDAMFKEYPESAGIVLSAVQKELSLTGQLSGKKLNEVEIREAIWAATRESVTISGMFGSSSKPAILLTVKDLPNYGSTDAMRILKAVAKEEIRSMGQDREPTEIEMQDCLTKIMLGGKNLRLVIPPDVAFDNPLMDKIKATWSAQHGGREMPKNQQLRYYLIARAQGEYAKPSERRGVLDGQTLYME